MFSGAACHRSLRSWHCSVSVACRCRCPRSRRAFHTTYAIADIGDVYYDQLRDKRFHCTQCGKCCTGAGEIWVDKTDVDRLAKKIHVEREIFLSRYVKSYSKKPGFWLLRNTNGTQDCIFLRGTECIVNDAKPLQCRTYPYWPELMDPEAWEAERSDVCEGIDHEEAPQIDIEQAALQLQASTEFFARRDGSVLL